MTNLDIAQELLMQFHKEKPEEMHLLQFSMWIDGKRKPMYKPTEEELLELGFKRETLCYVLKNFSYQDDGQWLLYDTISTYKLFPESKQDIETLIRLFKLK